MPFLLLLACAVDTSCPTPSEWFEPSCTDDSLEPGCYTRCDGLDAPCEEGTCSQAAVNPCYGEECQACGADLWLCL